MRNSKLNIESPVSWVSPQRLTLFVGFLLVSAASFGQGGVFSGAGTIEVSSGLDGNVWRTPADGPEFLSSPENDAFTRVHGSWKKEIIQGANLWSIQAAGDVKRQVIQSAANSHRAGVGAKLLHEMNARVRGEVGMTLAQQRQLEVHWADEEQWKSMDRMELESYALMDFDARPNVKADLGVRWSRAAYLSNAPDYGNQLFTVHASWHWTLLRHTRGLRRYNLVKPQRTKEGGTLSAHMQFSQRNFNDWHVSWRLPNELNAFSSGKYSVVQGGSMPDRVWAGFQLESRYSTASNRGWNVFVDAILKRRFDESLGDFGMQSWTAGTGLMCRSNFLKLELGVYREMQVYDLRLARVDGELKPLQYQITSWNLVAEVPTVRGWSYVVRSTGRLRESNYEGASMWNRNSMGFQQVAIGIRWHLGYRRFLAI